MGKLYDDGRISCDDRGVRITWYYLWGAKFIPYQRIRGVERRALGRWRGGWRLWGSGDFVRWYNLDRTRPRKQIALELHTGRWIRPTITPDDPDTVERILNEHRT